MYTVIFQSAKLGDISHVLREFEWAKSLLDKETPVDRVYGLSAGSLVALSFALAISACREPQIWGNAYSAIQDFESFLQTAKSRHLRSRNINPLYGIYNLKPLRHWIASQLRNYFLTTSATDGSITAPPSAGSLLLSHLSIPLYLCAIDRDGTFSLFGPLDPTLQFQYHAVHVGPPADAPILDSISAALSTLLSTEPAMVHQEWFRDCRPAIVDAGAIVFDLQVRNSHPILRTPPYAPIRPWKQNWITSSFIMHSQNERNQTLLASYYLDLQERHISLRKAIQEATGRLEDIESVNLRSPHLDHVDLPYIGSTEAFTNMRQSVENKAELMAQFRDLLLGQLEGFPFEQPANVIYGAGGFSGILAGLVTTRFVDVGFEQGGGAIQQIYGVSAGVLNGFFHAIQLAAARYPDLYKPVAQLALSDLEDFIAHIEPKKVARLNLYLARFWKGWANLRPLEEFLLERLAAYTGSQNPEQILFDDIGLPMTIAVARRDGFTDFLGMTRPDRRMNFGGKEWQVRSAPIVRAIIAGWSMNTYIIPTELGDQSYTDGGGPFYDIGLFVTQMDPAITNLLNIHLDEPEGHSYNIPERPNLMRILLDTHNYIFPEERRRMRALCDLLYQHYRLREKYTTWFTQHHLDPSKEFFLPPDFRRDWSLNQSSLPLESS